MNGNQIWCAVDSPLSVRIERKFLCSLKKLLESWDWQSFEVRVDLEAQLLVLDGHPIIRVNVCEQDLDVKFIGD